MKKRKKYRIKPRFYVFLAILIMLIAGIVMLGVSCAAEKEKREEAGLHALQGWKMAMSARAYISNDQLRYDDAYFDGGYSDDSIGVCTDVVWNAFRGVNITLKQLVDGDIDRNFNAYKGVISVADQNINFRQVPVLEIFFERKAEVLTTDLDAVFAWMPGDIVTFESSHVAVVSGLRNIWGRPYIIQHGKDPAAEEDRLYALDGMKISGHFRWPLQK